MGAPSTRPLRLVPPPDGDGVREDQSLNEIFREHAAYVAYIGVRILGQDDEIDDLVQDVFVEALRGLRGLRDAGALRGWLGRVTVRAASRRLKVRRLRRFFGLDEGRAYEHAWTGASPEQCALVARVYGALDDVPAKHRIAWILRVVEGEPVDEVARLCDVSRATAKRWVGAVQQRVERMLGHG